MKYIEVLGLRNKIEVYLVYEYTCLGVRESILFFG